MASKTKAVDPEQVPQKPKVSFNLIPNFQASNPFAKGQDVTKKTTNGINYGGDILSDLAKPAAQKRANPFAFGSN